MGVFIINGGRRLDGVVRVQGAKNSALPILAASLLASGTTIIHNCPDISDVDAAIKILRHLGCMAVRDGDSVAVDSSSITRCDIPDGLMREMRSSVIFLGAILARTGQAILSMPGGCELGPRPIGIHLAALAELGASVDERNGNIICTADTLTGCCINLPIPSVGATENSMLAASCADGTTIITNAACEPEIVELQNFLVSLGARILGAGTPTIVVEGCKFGGNTECRVLPDRIAAATYMCACASAGGKILMTDVCPEHLQTVTDALSRMGCIVKTTKSSVFISSDGYLKAIKPIITRPYPGFPTDAQPVMMAAALKAEGTTVFVENIFSNRYRHVGELLRMGADIRTEGRVAMVSGVRRLHAAPVFSTDLRGGAALVVAALGAEGATEINEIHHIDRGYSNLEGRLCGLGADIKRI
ncbi:MAG: UDP-N-acetylglucosamine 1-carboxyvinyltransferase [Oscillospiraceae bacterium]|nr:UDP-N-acetylglucosamine 1-carboxyvinyltransferase [Oscillospiraceae bacterium]